MPCPQLAGSLRALPLADLIASSEPFSLPASMPKSKAKTKPKTPSHHPHPNPNVSLVKQTLIVGPGPDDRSITLPAGEVVVVPDTWELLPPGDAGVTRRVKAAGPTWTVKERKGRREFSQGLWADAAQIRTARASMEATRSTPQYAKSKAAAKTRRDEKQGEYVEDFKAAVTAFLAFNPTYGSIADRLSNAVTEHATPVGSGTVARTERIPIERRAESAVIAWMRHQTTAYDNMAIARIKGERREVRRQLATESRRLLQKYRSGDPEAMKNCPLAKALRTIPENTRS
ncbi:hypothetical protein Poly21_43620 [Allorhodopirellula heiligendammensis]|uniref:DUF2293 domain-containing protein n=2 Tax=Allorhodopirellula heiligendammensis TaxID=2714739 RepID=A0A5C6BEI1_9BACT|nr:hypothetical protein Poly21_43620 [Allorhodopirellula heiligendammensis]